MTYYEIIVNNGTDIGTVMPDVGFNYTDKLNEINEGTLKFSGTGKIRRGLLIIGAKVEIKRNGTRDFYGEIQTIDYMSAGTVVARLLGQEVKTTRKKGSYSNSPYKSTASATIANDIIGESSTFTAGTVEAGYTIDFRISTSQTIYNALSNLVRKTSQDVSFDYINTEIDVLDHKGSSTPVATLNNGIEIKNMRVTYGMPKGNSIKVWGKGDGNTHITGTDSDATSIATYGTITRDVIDRSIMSDDEADRLATAELALTKDPTKIYDFDTINPYLDYVSGDNLYLNASDMDLDNEQVRIVGINRGEKGGNEFMTLQVVNASYKTLMKNRNKLLAEVMKDSKDTETYMQGTTNVLTFSEMINSNSSAPLRIYAYLPSAFIIDEAGNNRVSVFDLDYDIDPYRSGVGTATEDNVSPTLSGDTDAHKHDAADSGHLHLGDTDYHNHSVGDNGHPHANATQTSTANFIGSDEGSDYDSSVSCPSGQWTTVVSEYVGSADGTVVNFFIFGVSGGAEDIMVKLKNSGVLSTNDAFFGIYQDGFRDDSFVQLSGLGGGPCSADFISVQVYPFTGAITVGGYVSVWEAEHTHSISSWNTNSNNAVIVQSSRNPDLNVDSDNASISESNKSPLLNGNAASHNHNVSIGDAVSDAELLNATQVGSIKLYYYNTATSSWDLKNTILNTGKTLDRDVDLSAGGTYPDAAGAWKVEILTDSANPDLVQGVIKCKHEIDN